MLQARAHSAVPPNVRKRLEDRSGGLCEAQLIGCRYWAVDPHHRITQKAGGRHGQAKLTHDRLSNLLHLCRPCHQWATSRADLEAYEIGLCLREHQHPSEEPVVYRGELCLLADDGHVLNCEVPSK